MKIPALFAALLGLSSTAFAQNIVELEARAREEHLMSVVQAETNGRCQTQFSGNQAIDWVTWKTALPESTPANPGPADACRAIFTAIGSVCQESSIARDIIVRDIDKVVCKGDGSASDPKIELGSKVLTIHTARTAKPALYDTIRKFLREKLV